MLSILFEHELFFYLKKIGGDGGDPFIVSKDNSRGSRNGNYDNNNNSNNNNDDNNNGDRNNNNNNNNNSNNNIDEIFKKLEISFFIKVYSHIIT